MDTWKVLKGSGVGFLERVVLGPRIGGFVNGLMCSFDGLECLKFFDDEIGCVERGGKDVEKENRHVNRGLEETVEGERIERDRI